MSTEKHGKVIDMSHHLSEYSKAFQVSPLKLLQKYMERTDMISFAGALPSAEYFPFSMIYADILTVDSYPLHAPRTEPSAFSWLWRLFGAEPAGKEHTVRVAVPKTPSPGDEGLNLATALQYGPATGIPKMQKFINEFTARVHQPAYSDFATLVHTGNTDGWSRVVKMLCNPGDTVITEEWTYPSATTTAAPNGVKFMPIAMDGEGMRADSLRKALSEWDATTKGRRPHVLYTVPIGQNPSGSTMNLARKSAIYEICVEFDVIIVEDDPYFFFQAGDYVPKSARKAESQVSTASEVNNYIASLAPSYLRVDTDGRVIRLETFSKTIAPGVRLGWFTCNALFAERLERLGETAAQSPSGLSQALVMKLLETWQFEGYIRWLQGLRTQYRLRRDFFCDVLGEEFDLHLSTETHGAWAGCDVYTAYEKAPRGMWLGEKHAPKPLLSFVPPSSGMFVWTKLHFSSHPAVLRGDELAEALESRFWVLLAQAGVLTAPGRFFATDQETPAPDGPFAGHLRLSYAMSEIEETRRGIAILAAKLREFFNE